MMKEPLIIEDCNDYVIAVGNELRRKGCAASLSNIMDRIDTLVLHYYDKGIPYYSSDVKHERNLANNCKMILSI